MLDVVEVCLVEVEGMVMVVLMVLVVVLHVGLIFLAVHEDEPEMVKVDVWVLLVDFDVQLHDVTVVNLVDVVTAAGIAVTVWKMFNTNAKYNKDSIVEGMNCRSRREQITESNQKRTSSMILSQKKYHSVVDMKDRYYILTSTTPLL